LEGNFGSVRPSRPIRGVGDGVGAFEIAFRFSRLDLNDKEIRGGVLNDFTAAINWYPNRNARVMLNFIRAKRDRLDPIWVAQIRLQWAY
jgi:phosphate-selective porin OprO/OprP